MLNEKEMADVKYTYNLYAKKNGKLIVDDIGITIRALGISITDPEIADITKDLDSAGTAEIDFPEFISFVGFKYKNLDIEEVLKQCFELFDRDRNGKISVRELGFVFSNLGYKLEKKDIDMLLKDHELQHLEELTYDDFYKLMV